MTLKKTISSTIKYGKEIIPQCDVEMHPLEEAATLAHWAIHEEKEKIPPQPSKDEEHEWLIEHGAEYVKQKRIEWQTMHDNLYPAVQKAEILFQESHDAWNHHVELCVANGYDPDKFDGDARNSLTMPDKDINNAIS